MISTTTATQQRTRHMPEMPKHHKFQDLTGKTFGKLTVLEYVGRKGAATLWNVKCLCGREKTVRGGNLRSGMTKSCGRHHQQQQHKPRKPKPLDQQTSKFPLYSVWQGMKARCYNKNGEAYKSYGGRGITVCERWRNSFDLFQQDMGPRPEGEYSINRVDNDRGYEPGNCQWATQTEQMRNTRVNQYITHDGKTLCIAEWAELVGMSYGILYGRLQAGWNFQKAIETPVFPPGKKPAWMRFPQWKHLKQTP